MRPSLSTILLCALLLPLGAAEDNPNPGGRPNILLILVDDLKPALGCYGDPHAKTPNIDALSARGLRFDLAYCNQAVCAPSRFTLMLGSHSTSTGLYGLGSHLRKAIPDAVTIPQHFARHGGYRTESLGKIFHIGHGNHGDPESFSVPHYKEKVIEYCNPTSKPDGGLTREEAMFQNQPAPPGGMNSLPRGAAFESPEVPDDAYADGRVAAETIRRLKAAKERRTKDGTPFFIAAGFARPHLPFSAPKKYWDLFDPDQLPLAENPSLPKNSPTVAHKRGGEIRNYFPVPDKNDPAQIDENIARQLVHGYYASTSYVDVQIGKVIAGLDELGLADDTIIVLWGDHGFHLGDLGIWTKHTNYEQANRIPLLITAPGVTHPNTSTKQLAESVDLFPTLAELAGLPAPAGPQVIDGVSLVPVLKDPTVRVRDHAYHAYPKQKLGRAIRTERYRLVEWAKGSDDIEYELYDYEADPLEKENLAKKRPAVVNQLKHILARHPAPVGRKAKGGQRTQASSKPNSEAAGKHSESQERDRQAEPQPLRSLREPAPSAAIEAGLEAHDRALFIKSGWIRDPFITLGADGFYYLTGTTPLPDDPRQHTDPFNTGLGDKSIVGWKAQVWRSQDLIGWQSLATPFTLEDGIWPQAKPEIFVSQERSQWRLWAPELHWLGDKWALVHTSPAPVKGANLSLTAGAELGRPWTNPMGTSLGRKHDPSLFRDDDGTWWMVWGATQIAPLKPDFSGFTAAPTKISPGGETKKMGHEGCLLHKIAGKYVLFGTGWSTGQMRKGSYNLYYATADQIGGPYSAREFVGRFLGHGTPFQDKQGRWWCTAFYNANVSPLSPDGIRDRDLSQTAQTINQQGVTLVPLVIRTEPDGSLLIRAKDPNYANPGPDELQKFK